MLKEILNLIKLGSEENVRSYLMKKIPSLNMDLAGNLFHIRSGKPILCAHMDTVVPSDSYDHLKKKVKIKIEKNGDQIIKCDGNILGGDDRVGIAIALAIYEQHPLDVSLLFTSREESGCVGSNRFDPLLLTSAPYVIVIDRKGKSDIIGFRNDYCSKEFQDAIVPFLKPFGYTPSLGVYSDADALSCNINCINVSCGYYNQHTKDEYVNMTDVRNAKNAIEHLALSFTERMEPFVDDYFDPHIKRLTPPRSRYYDEDGYSDEYSVNDLIDLYDKDAMFNEDVELVNQDTGEIIQVPAGYYKISVSHLLPDYAQQLFI